MKSINHIGVKLAIGIALITTSLGSLTEVDAQPYYDAYFTSIMVTNGNDTIELISGGTAKVYDGQTAWKNLTFYNEACGVFGANLYTKIYADDTLRGTSSERYVWQGSYSNDDWYSTEYGPAFYEYKVELWWDSDGTHYLEDRKYFNIRVVRLFVSDWSPSTLSVEKGKTTPSTLSVSFQNGGNDYMYDASISVIDSDGLTISPDTQNLQDIVSGGSKSTDFSVTAPTTASLGTHIVSFEIDYNDFRNVSHSETTNAQVDVTKLSTSIDLSLESSTLKIGGSTTITAKLTDGNNVALENEEIGFYIGTTSIGTAMTDSSGNAVKAYVANVDAGTHIIDSDYEGSINYGSSSATKNLIITQYTTTLSIDVPSATVGKECTLKTTLKDENGNAMENINIDFYIYEENAWKKFGSAKTDSNGLACLKYTPSSTGTSQVKAVFSGTTNYAQSSSTPANLNVAMDYTPFYIGGGIIAVAIIGVAGYMVFRRRKKVAVQSQK